MSPHGSRGVESAWLPGCGVRMAPAECVGGRAECVGGAGGMCVGRGVRMPIRQ